MKMALKGVSFFLTLSLLTNLAYGDQVDSSKGSNPTQVAIPQTARIHFGPGPRFMKVEHSYTRTHGSSHKAAFKKATPLNDLVRTNQRSGRQIHFGPGPSGGLGAFHPTINSVRRTSFKGAYLSKASLRPCHRVMKGKK